MEQQLISPDFKALKITSRIGPSRYLRSPTRGRPAGSRTPWRQPPWTEHLGCVVWIFVDQRAGGATRRSQGESGAFRCKAEDRPRTGRTRVIRQRSRWACQSSRAREDPNDVP
jgi:hypothetical protein